MGLDINQVINRSLLVHVHIDRGIFTGKQKADLRIQLIRHDKSEKCGDKRRRTSPQTRSNIDKESGASRRHQTHKEK